MALTQRNGLMGVTAFVTVAWLGTCASGNSPRTPETTPVPAPSRVTVGQILADPRGFRGRLVVLEARCCGWGCPGTEPSAGHPGISRSDGAVEDGTGAIYVPGAEVRPPCSVSGTLPAEKRFAVSVRGVVCATREGTPYVGSPDDPCR